MSTVAGSCHNGEGAALLTCGSFHNRVPRPTNYVFLNRRYGRLRITGGSSVQPNEPVGPGFSPAWCLLRIRPIRQPRRPHTLTPTLSPTNHEAIGPLVEQVRSHHNPWELSQVPHKLNRQNRN